MTHRLLLSAAAALLLACPGPVTKADAGADAGGEEPVIEFNVSGKATVHPDAVNFLADAGLSFAITGLTARVEEPLRVALEDPLGVFSSATLDATGAYSATAIPQDLVNIGVAVGLRDDAADGGIAGRVVRSATVIFDVALQGKKPAADLKNTVSWAVPTSFHNALTALVTPATIGTLTSATPADTLIGAGFILGRIVDAAGAPVSGAAISPSPVSEANRFFYPSADLKSLGTTTSSNGLFLYVHNGGDVKQFRFSVKDNTAYKMRSAGATSGACLVVSVYPGLVAP